MREQGAEPKPAELLGVIVLMDDPEKGRAESRLFVGEWAPAQRERAAQELRKIADDFASPAA